MCIYSPMPHTLSYCALIGKCALIRSNTVNLKLCTIRQVHLKDSIEMRLKKSERLILVSTTGKTGERKTSKTVINLPPISLTCKYIIVSNVTDNLGSDELVYDLQACLCGLNMFSHLLLSTLSDTSMFILKEFPVYHTLLHEKCLASKHMHYKL